MAEASPSLEIGSVKPRKKKSHRTTHRFTRLVKGEIAAKISYQKSAVVIRTTMANLAKYQPNEDLVATGKGT